MHRVMIMLLATLGPLATLSVAEPDGKMEKVAQQKKAALANWEIVGAGDNAVHETKQLILVAPRAMEKRLKEIGLLLEKGHDQARRVLAFDSKQEPYAGKITVYLLPSKEVLHTFMRRVERSRVEGEELGSFSATDEDLHAAVCPPRAAGDLPLEGQAVAQNAAALLVRRAGVKTPVADWLVEGFGRATWHRLSPRDRVTLEDRRAASRLAGVRSAKEIYEGLIEAREAKALRGSLADYLAYGPYASKFPALLKGFEPEENIETKTTAQALDSAGIGWERLDKGWKTWALTVR